MIVVRGNNDRLPTTSHAVADHQGVGGLETDTDSERNATSIACLNRHHRRFIPRLHVAARLRYFSGKGRDEVSERNEFAKGNGNVLGVTGCLVHASARLPHRQPVLHAVTLV